MPSQHQENLKQAFARHDLYMSHVHEAKFEFHHSEVFQRFTEKPNKLGVLCKSFSEHWSEDLGVCSTFSIVGAFRGTMLDNLTDNIRQDLALGGLLFEEFLVEPGIQKSTKIECVRVDKLPTKLPSVMTSKELAETWLNPNWTP